GVVDLARFLGIQRAEPSADVGRVRAQLVAFNATLEINCALLVDRLAGLRGAEQLTIEPDTEQSRPSFVGGRFRDAAGRLWQEILLSELAHHDAFLRIVG
ncbi:MAG TPA: chemotaxis protein CheW, partial [Casimicrobiaceae bacterium]